MIMDNLTKEQIEQKKEQLNPFIIHHLQMK